MGLAAVSEAFDFDFGLFLHAISGLGETVVLNPAMVGIAHRHSASEHFAAVQFQTDHFAGGGINGDTCFPVAVVQAVERSPVGEDGLCLLHLRKSSTLAKGKLCAGLFVSRLTPCSGGAVNGAEVEEHFGAPLACLGNGIALEAQGEEGFAARGNVGHGHPSGFHHAAVVEHFIEEVIGRKVAEDVAVLNINIIGVLCGIAVLQCKPYPLVCSLHLAEFGALLAGGGNDAVGAEVALVGTGIVVARVEAVDVLLHFGRVEYGLVHPVPYAAADAAVRVFDDVPVFVEVSDGVTHGMGIFADEHRLVEVRGVPVHPFHVGIHFGVEVGIRLSAVRTADACALVVYGTCGVESVCFVVARLEVRSGSCLVAQAPHHDAGMVPVACDEACNAVREGRNPRFHVRNALVGMVFEVSLVAGPESKVVHHGVEVRVVGIVRGAYHVDVVLLHQREVAEHRPVFHGPSALGVGVVAVHTLEEHPFAVDVYQAAPDFDMAESVFCTEGHLVLAVGILHHHIEGVEVGVFVAPEFHVGHVECNVEMPSFHGAEGVLTLLHEVAFRIEETYGKGLFLLQCITVVDFKLHVESCLGKVLVEVCRQHVVTHRLQRHAVEADVAVDTAHAEHVLAFEVRAVAPSEHLYAQTVVTTAEMLGEVKLVQVVRSLGVAHVFPVEPDEGSGIDAVEADEGAAALPGFGEREVADIGAYGIDAVVCTAVVESCTGVDEGWGIAVGIFHVAVDGLVVALHLPVRGDGDVVPCRIVESGLEEVGGALRGFVDEVELPRAVEVHVHRTLRLCPRCGVVFCVGCHFRLAGVGHVIGDSRLLVDGKDGLVFPRVLCELGFFHRLEGEPCLGVSGVERAHFQFTVGRHPHAVGLSDRRDDVDAGLSFHGHQSHTGVSRIREACRPLQQVVDGTVVSAVVHELAVEGTSDEACLQSLHLHVPVLSAVFGVNVFEPQACPIVGIVVVADDAFGVLDAADVVGQGIVKSGDGGAFEAEECAAFLGSILAADEGDAAVGGGAHGHFGAVGRGEDDAAAHFLDLPYLHFVGTVDLAGLHVVVGGTEGDVPEGADEAPGARKFADVPVLSFVVGIGFGKPCPGVGKGAEGHTAQMIERAAFVGRLGRGGERGDCHNQ